MDELEAAPAPESPSDGVALESKPVAESSPAAGDVKPDSSPGTDGVEGVKPNSLDALIEAGKKIASDEMGKVVQVEESPPSETAKTPDSETVEASKDDPPKKERATPAPERVKELLAERKEILPRAESFDQLASWVQSRNLTQEDFNTALEIGALLKNDPHEAYKRLQPIYTRLQGIVGEILPDDLVAKVEAGQIDSESATELAKARSRADIAEQNRNRVVEQSEAQRRTEASALHVRNIAVAVSQWENDWKKSDLDYSRKSPFVSAQINALMTQEGYPRTPDEAVAQVKRARELVEKQLAGMLPAPKQVTVVTGGSHSGSTAPQPKSSLEAMRIAGQQRSAA